MQTFTVVAATAILLLPIAGYAQEPFAVTDDSRPAATVEAERQAQQQNNQAMNRFKTDAAVPYTVLSETGTGPTNGLIWVIAPEADTFLKRAHTVMKAAQDFHKRRDMAHVRAHLVTLPNREWYQTMYQGVAVYDAAKAYWRAFAYDGPAIPEWKVSVTEEWLDTTRTHRDMTDFERAALQERLARQFDIAEEDAVPLDENKLTLTPYHP